MSIYLGEELTKFLEGFRSSADTSALPHFKEESKDLDLGSRVLAPIR